MKAILSLVVLLSTSAAMADQCQWNSKTDGRSALEFLKKGSEVILWCQKCNEVKGSVVNIVDDVKIDKKINQISLKLHQKNSGQKLFNGDFSDVDLAYSYVRTSSDTFANLAHLVGCPSTGATTFLQLKGNAKIPHFYDFNGVRQDGAPEVNELAAADLEKAISKGQFRAPASAK